MNFIINNQENLKTNLSTHNTNMRNKYHLDRPKAKLSCFQKSTYYTGIKIFNSLPCRLTIIKKGEAKFKVAVLKYLNTHSFY